MKNARSQQKKTARELYAAEGGRELGEKPGRVRRTQIDEYAGSDVEEERAESRGGKSCFRGVFRENAATGGARLKGCSES
ncbi:hypothetical protein RUM44_008551 [Polyplax serrata]|uniref:Uncharacterized protein n=1 Tax=Polyplax serrata TaxID=468196 RepID=A0ABR1BCK4_POLSC